MRTDSAIATGIGSGVLVINFKVANGSGGVGALVGNVVQTSLPILPSLAVIVLLAMIMPRRSARRRLRLASPQLTATPATGRLRSSAEAGPRPG
jgi:hypothetical protein